MSDPATESATPTPPPGDASTSNPDGSLPQGASDLENTDAPVSFEQASYEEQPGLVAEFLEFLVESKAWWLTPIIVVLLLVGLLIVLSGSVIAPFIYPIF